MSNSFKLIYMYLFPFFCKPNPEQYKTVFIYIQMEVILVSSVFSIFLFFCEIINVGRELMLVNLIGQLNHKFKSKHFIGSK